MLPATKNSSYNLSSPFILYLCHTLKIYKPKYYKTMAKELELKYGCNPNQKPSRIFMQEGELPIEVLNGRPGYINFLDAFNSWQLVKELKEATGLPAATSFKHVSPAGAAVGIELNDTLKKIYFVNDLPLTPLATAYARARGADRMSSYGDFIALSDTCDEATARLINREVSDGVIAPDYTPEALEILKNKRKGTYNVIKIDPAYRPAPIEHKDVFGITFEQGRNEIRLDLPNYVVGFVYGALVESFSCEQNARMMAMQSASNSARDMLAELDILYNRARQAAITQEITEVIAGAKSQKKKRK